MTSILNKNLFFIICCLFVVSIGFVHYSNAAKTAAFDIDEPIYAVQAAVVAPNALTFWTEVPSNIQPFFYGYLWGTILWLHGHYDIRTYLTQARLMGHQNRPGTLICNVNTLADNLCNNTFTIIREIRTFTPIIATTILFVTWLIGYFFSSY